MRLRSGLIKLFFLDKSPPWSLFEDIMGAKSSAGVPGDGYGREYGWKEPFLGVVEGEVGLAYGGRASRSSGRRLGVCLVSLSLRGEEGC
jgi:hypothetical protein